MFISNITKQLNTLQACRRAQCCFLSRAVYCGVRCLEEVVAKITEIAKLAVQELTPESDPRVALAGPHFNTFFQISKGEKAKKQNSFRYLRWKS